jgi:hypothetical protein
MEWQSWLTSLDPNQIGLGAIVTLMIVSILRGWIIPRSVHLDRISDKDKQIVALGKERDNWKEAYEKSAEAKRELIQQNSALIDGADTTNHLLDSLRNQIERNGLSAPRRQIKGPSQ